MVALNRKVAAELRCRFGCEDGPVGIYHVPEGCVCWEDPIQALCQQHVLRAQSVGPIDCIVDLTITPAQHARRQLKKL